MTSVSSSYFLYDDCNEQNKTAESIIKNIIIQLVIFSLFFLFSFKIFKES